jgi:hypothetical protein
MFNRKSVKLPRYKPNNMKHVLIHGLDGANSLGLSTASIADKLEVTPQTLLIWKNKATKDRNFLLPGEQIPALSKALGIAPYFFRPDLWPNRDWRF